MTEKTNSLGKELLDVLKIVGHYITTAWTWAWRQIQKIKWRGLQKTIAVVLVAGTSIAIALETIITLFVLGDPLQTERVINTFAGFNIFDYITTTQYVAFIAGGFVLDIVILTLVMWFGIWLWGGTNWFTKPKYAWVYACFAGLVGFAIMFGALFYAAPNLAAPLRQLHIEHHVKHKNMKQYRNIPVEVYYQDSQSQFKQRQQELDRLRYELERQFWR